LDEIFKYYTKMPKKPFLMRSGRLPHIKYAKKMKKLIGKYNLSKIEKIRFFCERLAERIERTVYIL